MAGLEARATRVHAMTDRLEDTMSSDNITLIRAAKPTKKDLPAGKDVKGGKKRA